MAERAEPAIMISGMGAVSAGGHTVAETCATIRAGVSMVTESSELTVADAQGHQVAALCGEVIGITDGQRRFLRHLRMAVPACAEAVSNAKLDAATIRKSGLYLCLQEVDRPGMDNRPQELLAKKLSLELDLPALEARARVYSQGHAGLFTALEQAFRDLLSGKYSAGIIGAIDTYLDDITLDWLRDLKRLKTSDSERGFLPGEGAAFLVVEAMDIASRRGIAPLAMLLGPSTALEPNSIYDSTPCHGAGLSECIRKTFASVSDGGADTGMIICDLNGERYRSQEWGWAIPKALGHLSHDVHLVHPAECIGDTGAASAAINTCFAAMALEKGIVGTSNALIWGSSDDGERGSVCLTHGPGTAAARRN